MVTSQYLRPFQERVRDHILVGRNVILQAPTGAGKTRAALAPFVQSLEGPATQFPHTCRYAVPMRVLANQFVREYRDHFARLDRRLDLGLERAYEEIEINVPAIQTGEASQDPRFESPATFCTIDQLLASFIGIPYGLIHRQGNLNVAGVAGSYLVLDEFHLYPLRDGNSRRGARTTTLAMLRLLHGLTPFVLMTATLSTSLVHELAELLGATVEDLRDMDGNLREEELKDILEGRERSIAQARAPLTADAVLDCHEGTSLVVCNTVLRAQEIYLDLRRRVPQDCKVILLHSRFTTQHRGAKSEELERLLGKDAWTDEGFHVGPDVIVVATQVVEVGLNISAGTLHTELAPANSLIQRAGRCARFAHQRGRAIVYPLARHPIRGTVTYLPYDERSCQATWRSIKQLIDGREQAPMGYAEEQRLIDEVHTPEDTAMIQQFKLDEIRIQEEIFKGIVTGDRSQSGSLIRDIAQVRVLVHPDPKEAITEEPWRWQSFGLHPNSLANSWESLDERQAALGLGGPGWTMLKPEAIEEAAEGGEQDSRLHTHYTWVPVSKDEVRNCWIVAIPPEMASYDSDLGFVLVDGRLTMENRSHFESGPEAGDKWMPGGEGGEQQSYVEHISGLINAYHQYGQPSVAYLARRLEERLCGEGTAVVEGSIDRAIRLALACHDTGKLARDWQAWARAWHAVLVQNYRPSYAAMPGYLAKTTFYWNEHRKLRDSMMPKRPPHHACESVRLAGGLIAAALGGNKTLARATLSAIARHHTTNACEYAPAILDEGAVATLGDALARASVSDAGQHLALVARSTPEGAGNLSKRERIADADITRQTETWLYALIVRALRLADQRADQFRDRS